MHFWLSLYLSFFTHGYVQKQHSQATYVTEKPISWAPCRLWSTEHFTSIWGAVKCNLAHPHHLCPNRVRYTSCKVKRNKRKLQCRKYKKKQNIGNRTYLLQLIITSSGMTRRFNIPCFGWSPRPRNRPGGSILKLPIFCLWPSIIQNPYSFWTFSLATLIAWQQYTQTCKQVHTNTHWFC